MKAFKRREVTDLEHLRTLVADNADAMEPDLKILASNLNFGRTSVELAAVDAERVPVLFVLGLTADDAMLIRALEAYAWCLEYPESVQRLVPANVQLGWPPRIVFVAERLLEAFVRKLRLLNFSAVDCFEFRYVQAHGTAGLYLHRVDWAPRASGAALDARPPKGRLTPAPGPPPRRAQGATPPDRRSASTAIAGSARPPAPFRTETGQPARDLQAADPSRTGCRPRATGRAANEERWRQSGCPQERIEERSRANRHRQGRARADLAGIPPSADQHRRR